MINPDITAARKWIDEVISPPSGGMPSSDMQVIAVISESYEGGWVQFVKDTPEDRMAEGDPEDQEEQETPTAHPAYTTMKGACHDCLTVFDLSEHWSCTECGSELETIPLFDPLAVEATSVQTRVAFTKCGNGCVDGFVPSPDTEHPYPRACDECGGTGFKWPDMARKCWRCPGNGPEDKPGEIWGHPCPTCGAMGSIPSVTLKKVLDAAAAQGDYIEVTVFPEHMWRSPEGIRRTLSDYKEEIKQRAIVRINSGMPGYQAEDPTDAACEALLASPRSNL